MNSQFLIVLIKWNALSCYQFYYNDKLDPNLPSWYDVKEMISRRGQLKWLLFRFSDLHPCNLGSCSYLCLAHQYGYRCECPNVPQVANCTAYDVINLPPTPPPPVHPCTPNPCMDGTCSEVNTTNGVDFVCNCSVGHAGKRCQLYKGWCIQFLLQLSQSL